MNNKKINNNNIYKQAKQDIDTLNFSFAQMSGAWEWNDGEPYACVDIAKEELELVKAIASRYNEFEYEYIESKWTKFDDFEDMYFSKKDFENENVNENNYILVDAVAYDMCTELTIYLENNITKKHKTTEYLDMNTLREFIIENKNENPGIFLLGNSKKRYQYEEAFTPQEIFIDEDGDIILYFNEEMLNN